MNKLVLIIASIILAVVVGYMSPKPGTPQRTPIMHFLARFIGALALAAVTGFGIFGFMATCDYSEAAKRLPRPIGYEVLGQFWLSGAVMILRPGIATARWVALTTHLGTMDAMPPKKLEPAMRGDVSRSASGFTSFGSACPGSGR